jgi:threonine dehydratase
MVPAFHADIVLGVTSYWAELFRAAPDLDVIYVPIGQGHPAVPGVAVDVVRKGRGEGQGEQAQDERNE